MGKIDLEEKCKGFTSLRDCNVKCPKNKCEEYLFQKNYFESLQMRAQESSDSRMNLVYRN